MSATFVRSVVITLMSSPSASLIHNPRKEVSLPKIKPAMTLSVPNNLFIFG